MKIYTKTGDKGKTSLSSGERVLKSALRVNAYGTVDELNSYIGFLRTFKPPLQPDTDDLLFKIQNELFTAGTHLSSTQIKSEMSIKLNPQLPLDLETAMDTMTQELPPLKNFILPGGHVSAAQAHVCRTVCRRAERLCVELNENEPSPALNEIILLLNRLSDYFFVLARHLNIKTQHEEVIWKP